MFDAPDAALTRPPRIAVGDRRGLIWATLGIAGMLMWLILAWLLYRNPLTGESRNIPFTLFSTVAVAWMSFCTYQAVDPVLGRRLAVVRLGIAASVLQLIPQVVAYFPRRTPDSSILWNTELQVFNAMLLQTVPFVLLAAWIVARRRNLLSLLLIPFAGVVTLVVSPIFSAFIDPRDPFRDPEPMELGEDSARYSLGDALAAVSTSVIPTVLVWVATAWLAVLVDRNSPRVRQFLFGTPLPAGATALQRRNGVRYGVLAVAAYLGMQYLVVWLNLVGLAGFPSSQVLQVIGMVVTATVVVAAADPMIRGWSGTLVCATAATIAYLAVTVIRASRDLGAGDEIDREVSLWMTITVVLLVFVVASAIVAAWLLGRRRWAGTAVILGPIAGAVVAGVDAVVDHANLLATIPRGGVGDLAIAVLGPVMTQGASIFWIVVFCWIGVLVDRYATIPEDRV